MGLECFQMVGTCGISGRGVLTVLCLVAPSSISISSRSSSETRRSSGSSEHKRQALMNGQANTWSTADTTPRITHITLLSRVGHPTSRNVEAIRLLVQDRIHGSKS